MVMQFKAGIPGGGVEKQREAKCRDSSSKSTRNGEKWLILERK